MSEERDEFLTENPTDEVEVDLGEDAEVAADASSEIDLGEPEDDIDVDLGEADTTGEPELDLDLLGPADSDDVDLDFEGTQDEGEVDLSLEEEEDEEPEGADEELEKALAELQTRLAGEFGEWYVVNTYSGMENRVKQNLDSRVKTLNMEEFIFETIVPTEQVEEIRGNQKKLVTRTVLPGYVLVRMDMTDESWSTVRHTPSVTGFVGHAQNPVPIGLDEVFRLLEPSVRAQVAQATQGKPVRRKAQADFNVGDSVQIDDGPFAGVHATITELNVSSQRVKVLVEIVGREAKMDLTFAQIKKI